LTFDMQKKLESIKAKVKLIAANAEPAYAEASAWQALTGLAVAKAKEERPTSKAAEPCGSKRKLVAGPTSTDLP